MSNLIPCKSRISEERHGRLLLRFRASNTALDVLSGTLAMPRLTLGKTSSALVDTTANGLKEFCTPAGGQLDVPLFKHVREQTQILVTDAAPAELLASQVLRGRRSTGNPNRDQDPFFPSLVLVGRDAPHASMRLLKRPWHVIDDIKQVVQTTITDSESPCQKIFHSPNFSLWFSQATSSHAGPNVSSLSAAKHRFASFAKPMARMIVHLRAFLEVCHRILVSQGDADSGWVQSWMAEISAKKLLILACAADGADSLQEMTRHLDTEDCDPATLNETVWIFLQQLELQFTNGQVYNVTGYAQHCLTQLQQEPPLFILKNGQMKRLRVSEADKLGALQAMKPWVQLCRETCQAEFPSYHLFMSLKVLDLKNASIQQTERAQCLKRLALALKLDEHQLLAQFEALEPVASAFQKNQGCTSRDAWKQAVSRTQETTALRRNYDIQHLLPLLQAHAAWTSSTSAVEQSFSKAERTQGARNFGPKAADAERRSMVALAYKEGPGASKKTVALKAREIYRTRVSKHLGKIGRTRLDKGVVKKSRAFLAGKVTEKSLIAQRRKDVAARVAAATSSSSPMAAVHVDGLGAVNEKVQKEIDKQRSVARQKKLKPFGMDTLSMRTRTPSLLLKLGRSSFRNILLLTKT